MPSEALNSDLKNILFYLTCVKTLYKKIIKNANK